MKKFRASILSAALFTATAVLLSACGGGGGDNVVAPTPVPVATETVSGTAATGKALAGTVIVINKDGKASDPVVINADGTFKVVVPKGAPYLIKASNGKPGESLVELYSFLADATKQVNVTQLTTQALYDANGQQKVADLYATWAAHHADLTQAKVDNAARKVAANLKVLLTTAGLNPKTVNIFNDVFKANSTGLDKVLDQVQISYNCNISSCNVNYTVNGFAFPWNYTIDTTGYIVVTPPSAGNYDMKITVTVLGQTAPVVVIKSVPKPTSQAEFCEGDNAEAGLPPGSSVSSCSYSGNKGSLAGTVFTNGTNVAFTATVEFIAAT